MIVLKSRTSTCSSSISSGQFSPCMEMGLSACVVAACAKNLQFFWLILGVLTWCSCQFVLYLLNLNALVSSVLWFGHQEDWLCLV